MTCVSHAILRQLLYHCIIVYVMVQIVATVNVFIIFVSILTFCLKTISDLRVPVISNATDTISSGENGTQTQSNVVQNTTIVSPVFFFSDAVCNAWFTITLAIRFIFSTDRSASLLAAV